MFLSVVILASINKGQIFVEHPEVTLKAPAIFGKQGTETPTGVFLLEKAYSSKLQRNMLIFRRDGDSVLAIHSTVHVPGQNRHERLQSESPIDNRISKGCINISETDFEKLWKIKRTMVLQIH